jgi:hypothetical protein
MPPNVPQVQFAGGPVLASPILQSITFARYSQTADADALVASIGGTTFFQEAVSEYGVGPAFAAQPVHLAQGSPANLDDDDIKPWLIALIEAGTVMAPVPGAIYVIFYPSSTALTLNGTQSCWQFGGYHESVVVDGVSAAYAVIPQCTFSDWTTLQTTTSSASHEIVEAATDPTPLTPTLAWSGADTQHFFWQIVLGGEVADMCAQWANSFYIPIGYPYMVQRPWSNAQAAAGHDPCKPQLPGEVYFNSVPVLPDLVTISDGTGATHVTGGIALAINQTRTIDVQLFSDGPAAPWTVNALNPTTFPSELKLSWDTLTGQSGDVLHLTITVLGFNDFWNGDPFVIESTQGDITNYWLGYVGPPSN